MVPVYWITGQDNVAPVHLALLLMCVFDTLTLFLFFRLVRRLCTSPFTPILTALLWILHPRIIGVATNGLETALACFFVTWVLSHFQNHFAKADHAPTVLESIGLGGLLGLGMLARIDAILLAVVVTASLLWVHRTALRKALGLATLVNASAFLTYLPWLVYSFAYTGDFYPVSGSAVRLMTLSWVDPTTTLAKLYGTMARTALRAIAAPNVTLIYWLAVLLAVVLAFRHRLAKPCDGRATILAVSWGYAAVLACAYVFYIFGPHYFDRYLHPIRIPLLLTIALLIDAFFLLLKRMSIQVGAAIVGAGMAIVPLCGDSYFKDLMFGEANHNLGYMNLGLWARSTFSAGTVIGGSQTGAVGYFADNLKVVNLDGVVNRRCYESLVRRENLRYVREEGIRYLFGWKVNFAFLARMSQDFKPGDIEDIRPILGFRSWNADWYVAKVRYEESERDSAKR